MKKVQPRGNPDPGNNARPDEMWGGQSPNHSFVSSHLNPAAVPGAFREIDFIAGTRKVEISRKIGWLRWMTGTKRLIRVNLKGVVWYYPPISGGGKP